MSEYYYGLTDTGKVRSNNEDTFIAEMAGDGRYTLACVIDGVGGYAGGEVAASLARSSVLDWVHNHLDGATDPATLLKEALVEANRRIGDARQQSPDNAQMACVATAAIVDERTNQLYFAHVGDTRLYLFRDNTLVKISHDHSFVGFLEDSGRLTEAEAMNHAKRNEINKALGFDLAIGEGDYIETGSSPFLPGDLLLLCSDGLTDLVDRNRMAVAINTAGSLQQMAQQLVDAANNAGGKDNITVVLVKHSKQTSQHTATRPVAKVHDKNVEAPKTIATEYKSPVQPAPPKKKSGAVGLLSVLVILLLLATGWLAWQYFQNKRQAPELQTPVTEQPRERSQQELALIDSIQRPGATEVFMVTTAGAEPLLLSDSIVVNKEYLHIIGNGAVITSNGLFAGPAFTFSPQAKYILLDSLVLQGFDVAMVARNSAVHFKNVIFRNCRTPLMVYPAIPADTLLSGRLINTLYTGSDTAAIQTLP